MTRAAALAFAAMLGLALGVAVASCQGCGAARGPKVTMDMVTPASPVGPLRVRYARTITPARRQLLEAALAVHWRELDSAQITPAWQNALGNPPAFGFSWPQRDVQVYDVPFLTAQHRAGQLGWTDVETRTIHLVAGPGDTLPDATHQLVHSVYLPYDVHDRGAVWALALPLQAQTVAALRAARGLP